MYFPTPRTFAFFLLLIAGQSFAVVPLSPSIPMQDRGDRAVFTDVTSGPLGSLGNTTGASWGDYDGDGDPDLYVSVADGNGNQLLRNDGGDLFTNVTPYELAGQYNQGAVWGDYDNDGDLDLYESNSAIHDCLVRNDGGGVFTDVTSGILAAGGYGQGVAWGDFDQDGYIDLYVSNLYSGNRLMRNTGVADVFVDATCCALDDANQGWGVAWGDYDDDGDLDLYLVNYSAANRLYRNDGGGAFTDVTSGPLGDTGMGRSATWVDYDNDGDLDIYVTNNHVNHLFRNDGGGVFTDATAGPLGQPYDSWGAAWGDYDNDGDLDVYVTNRGASNHLLENEGAGVFAYATSGPLADYGNGQGVAWADYDGDGDLDLFFGNGELESNHLLRNDGAGGHWLHLDLVGVQSNRSAIGARVRLSSAGQSQIREVSGGSCYGSQNSLTVEFGLGAETVVDTLEIIWPSGIVQDTTDVSADQRIQIVEALPGTGAPDETPTAQGLLLHPCYPNPFNPKTRIRFELPENGKVSLGVFDVEGCLVKRLLDGSELAAGAHELSWDGRDERSQRVSSGLYYLRLEVGDRRESRVVTLLK